MKTVKLLWERWKIIAHKIGDFQARLLLSVFYFTVLVPFAVGVKVFSDPLPLHGATAGSWLDRPEAEGNTATVARRQF